MPGRQEGEDASIDDAQPTHATAHAPNRVDDGARVIIDTHGARAGAVEDGLKAATDAVGDLAIARHVRAGIRLGRIRVAAERPRRPERARPLQACHRHLHVRRIRQEPRVQRRVHGRVWRRDVHAAPGPRRAEDHAQRGVVGPVARVGREREDEVAQVRRQRDVFDLGPVLGIVPRQDAPRVLAQRGAGRVG